MLIAPGDFAALAENVITLMENTVLREALSAKARARAEQMFDTNKIAGELSDILHGI
jgi:glycosyltransferase involved in cell wall biosynthesis